ncbi:MAG: TetR/AcrR family transcriptional regulator [Actinomycetota bacterium]|nr:TetR/AcrR family transcriptional regulator [Actinomycetota bacterium]
MPDRPRKGGWTITASPATTSLTPKGRRTRAKILDAAKEVFSEYGYTAARMGDISSAADLSLGALYRYFTDKDELFAELFEDLHSQFLAATRPAQAPKTSDELRQSLRRANELYFTLYSEERDFMRAVVEASAVNQNYMDRWSAMYEEIADRFLRRVQRVNTGFPTGAGLGSVIFALVCLTEQVAYVNFSRSAGKPRMSATVLAELVTAIWWCSLEDGHVAASTSHKARRRS